MKRLILILALAFTVGNLWAQQTLWVATGQVKYAFNTQQVGQMPFTSDGTVLTVQGKEFAINDIDSIYVTSELVEGNTIAVDYNGSTASMVIAGNIATQVTPVVNGAVVSITQDTTMLEEVFYKLAGETDNGSFYHSGKYKATFNLNGLTLKSASGAAINIDNGKRIEINLIDGTVNTITDSSGGTHSAAFIVEGHSEFKGGGSLVLTGNTKHGFKSDEYMELKRSFTGEIRVKSAKGDGVSINQYLEVKNGNIIVEACEGDGIQVDAKADTTKLNNGQFIMSGGVISIAGTGDSGKGIKVEKDVNISGGVIEVVADDNALHSKTNMTITDGKIYAYSTAAHGVNAGSTLKIAGGTVVGYAATTVGYGMRGADSLYITGGNVLSIGALVSTPKAVDAAQPALAYKGVVAKTNYSLTDADGNAVMAFTQPRAYSSSKTHTVLISMPSIATGSNYTFNSGATLNANEENWHSVYWTGNAVTAAGTAMATGTAAAPYGMMQ